MVLARAALERMVTFFLRVCPPGSEPPQVYLSGWFRRSSGVDSCQLLGVARLGFLAVHTQRRYLVSGSSDRFKDPTEMTVAPGRSSLGAVHKDFPAIIDKVKPAPVGKRHSDASAAHSVGGGRSMVHVPDITYTMLRELCAPPPQTRANGKFGKIFKTPPAKPPAGRNRVLVSSQGK